MTIWIIISWVFVAIFTAVNIFIFLKLKAASQQMMKAVFPGAKNMNQAVDMMQKQFQALSRGGGRGGMDPRIKSAMDMLQQAQKGKR